MKNEHKAEQAAGRSFHDFGVSDKVAMTLSDMGFEEPTPIQKMVIPPTLEGKDVIGQAQTGTGKTAAFGIPLIERRPETKRKHPYAIVMAPTRELAMQVAEEINRIGARVGIAATPIYGGQSIELQIRHLRRGVDIVVGTPGRLIDHIERKTLVLKEIRTLVLDEADEMLNMGFIDDIERILQEIPSERQTLLFSATMPREILNIAKRYMTHPVHLRVDTSDMVVQKIKQVFYEVREEDKVKALTRLLDVEGGELTLVFCHTKREVDDVSAKLRQMGYPAGAIHGDFTQAQREDMIKKFKAGELDVLVATDVAARGLDIPHISHVINFSVPQDPEGYVHRVGRTGRAGKSGIAITFVTPRQYRQLRVIEQTAKTQITKAKLPSKAEVIKAKEDDLAETLSEVISSGKHEGLRKLARNLFDTHNAEDVAAAALSLLFGAEEIEEIAEGPSRSPRPASSFEGGRKGYVRLFMTIGKIDNVRVGDIVKSISAEAGIPAGKIGNIALFDKFSFVEVPANMADRVIHAVNDRIVRGRKVKVRHASR